jgi:hypothetical protein
LGNLRSPSGNGCVVQPFSVIGDEGRADFDYQAFGFLNDGVHDFSDHAIA